MVKLTQTRQESRRLNPRWTEGRAMTARHKQASGSALALAPLASVNGVENGTDRLAPFAWEDWFRHACPQQRALALGLAQQQGFLYPHQLPAVTNGKTPASSADSPASTVLSRILAGQPETLPPLAELPISCFDAELDDVQQQAVLRALATPDLFLLQGLPGTGKSRVLAEIVRQAAGRGWRVLFLAGHTVSLDVVLERLVGHTDVLAVRFLAMTEKLEMLPGWLRGFTLDEQKKAFCERVQTGARGNRQNVEAACRRFGDQGPHWPELQACAERYRELQERRRQLLERQHLPAAQATEQAADEADHSLLALRESLEKCDREITELGARIVELEPAYLAKKHTRFWTPAFWGSLFNNRVIPEMETAQRQLAEAQKRMDSLSQEIAQIEQRNAELRDRLARERTAALAAEAAALQEAYRVEMQAFDEDQRRLDDEWAECCRRLGADSIDKTPQAIAAAQENWLRKKSLGEEECQLRINGHSSSKNRPRNGQLG